MIFGLEIVMLVAGAVALATARLPLAGSRSVSGGAARFAGLLLALPLPLSIVAGFAIHTHRSSADAPVTVGELQGLLGTVELLITLGCLGLALVVAVVAPAKKSE
jgi:hypothetical protein